MLYFSFYLTYNRILKVVSLTLTVEIDENLIGYYINCSTL